MVCQPTYGVRNERVFRILLPLIYVTLRHKSNRIVILCFSVKHLSCWNNLSDIRIKGSVVRL